MSLPVLATTPVLTTTVVGSYPQPDWLVDRALLSKGVPRVRLPAMWRVPEPFLEQAQDDATIVAIREMERAGIDIISDGEIRRESYSNRFATALDGVDVATPAVITDRYGNQTHGAAGRRARAADTAGRAARHAVPSSPHRPPGQDHPARPVHHGPAGQERVLPRRGGAGDGLRGRGQRGGPRAAGRGRRRHPARRAVAPQRSRGGQALRGARDQSRARRPHGADRAAPLLRLRGGGEAPEADRLLVSAPARRDHRAADLDRGRPAAARPRACWPTWRARPSSWG